jgi:hypothetical protein
MWTTQPFVIVNTYYRNGTRSNICLLSLLLQECGGFVRRKSLASATHVRYERSPQFENPCYVIQLQWILYIAAKLLLHFPLSSDRLHQTNSSLIQAVLYCLYLSLFLYINHFIFILRVAFLMFLFLSLPLLFPQLHLSLGKAWTSGADLSIFVIYCRGEVP